MLRSTSRQRHRWPRRRQSSALSEPRSRRSNDTIAHRCSAHLSESFIRDQFLAHFGARVCHFMPELLALRDVDGAVRAVVGCRAAAVEPLFLETYTREPIEVTLARRNGFLVPRERIVEIGSLSRAATRPARSRSCALMPHLNPSRLCMGRVHRSRHCHERLSPPRALAARLMSRRSEVAVADARTNGAVTTITTLTSWRARIEDGLRACTPRAARRAQ